MTKLLSLLFVLSVLSPLPLQAETPPKGGPVVIDVLPNRACLYGHWVEDSVELIAADGAVYANGIRIAPTLRLASDGTVTDREPALPPRISHLDVAELKTGSQVVQAAYSLQRALGEEGLDPDEITARCIDFLEQNDHIREVKPFGGHSYLVRYANSDSTFMSIGAPYSISPPDLRQSRLSDTRLDSILNSFANSLSRGDLIMVAPSAIIRVPANELTNHPVFDDIALAKACPSPIDKTNWKPTWELPAIVAELVRHPAELQIDRRYFHEDY